MEKKMISVNMCGEAHGIAGIGGEDTTGRTLGVRGVARICERSLPEKKPLRGV